MELSQDQLAILRGMNKGATLQMGHSVRLGYANYAVLGKNHVAYETALALAKDGLIDFIKGASYLMGSYRISEKGKRALKNATKEKT